jgi:Protein of unknown function (DUF3467)
MVSPTAGSDDDDTRRGPPDHGLPAQYANHFEIRHNVLEFLLDFCQVGPDSPRPWCHTRIVTHPIYAKALFQTLRESIELYEASYGPISEDAPGGSAT